ncbi:extracellular solute-binding protein [bacterium]|nr:MAG: extracellular solute-binding protein [bacterium]
MNDRIRTVQDFQRLWSDVLRDRPSRRALLKGALLLGLSAPALGALLEACGSAPQPPGAGVASAGPDLEAARKEGTLVVLHGDIEADMVKFVQAFTAKTGIQATEQRLLPGAALPKLEAELRSGGSSEYDVYDTSDVSVMEHLRQQGRLQQYISKEMHAYEAAYKSRPEGFWTTYMINVAAIMYSTDHVQPGDAPKTYEDLLAPRWKRQIGFQDSSAGTQYAWWYLLKDKLPADYWDRLAEQQPRIYASSTQMMQDVYRGELLIGAKVSIFQHYQALHAHQPINVVIPPTGAPANLQVAGIIGGTKKPNAAKAYIDYLLSEEGQQAWAGIEGNYSVRSGVTVPGVPPLAAVKLLLPADYSDYVLTANHAQFVKLWNHISGL